MSISERTFEGAGGRELFLRHRAVDSPKAAIIVVHGFGEHSGRYLEALERFGEAGYAAYAMDLRGHGRSGGVASHLEGIANVVEDVHRLTELAIAETGGRPAVLLGHSMGALLALNQLLHHQSDYAACVVSATAILPPENASRLTIAMAGMLAKIVPLLPVSPLEKGVFTRNQEMIARDDADELMYRGGFRARTGHELLQAQLALGRRMGEITLPFLALHGGEDRVINAKVLDLLDRSIGSSDKTVHLYPGLYHEIMNEPERDEVFAMIVGWLDARVPPADIAHGAAGR